MLYNVFGGEQKCKVGVLKFTTFHKPFITPRRAEPLGLVSRCRRLKFDKI